MLKFANRNVKAFPVYFAITWDVIFIWTISTMFFTTQKGLTWSQVIALDSILMFVGCIMCIPINRLIQNLRPVIASRIGLFGYALYIILCIFGTHYATFVLGTFFLAMGYCVCGVKVNSILNQSLDVLKRGKDYDRIYGLGLSASKVIDAVGAIGISYVYSYDPYMAYWISFAVVVFGFIYSFLFKDLKKYQDRNVSIDSKVKKRVPRKPEGYLKILSSGFFLSLLFFMFMMRGTMSIVGSSFKIYLQQMIDAGMLSVPLFGYIYAIYRLTESVSCKYQFKFNLKFGVRSLIILVGLIFVTFFGTGLVYLYDHASFVSMVAIISLVLLQGMIVYPCRIFVYNYLQVCTTKRNIDRAHSIRMSVEYMGYAVISALYALLLGVFGDNYGLTNIVYIGILAVPIILSTVLFIRALCKQHAKKYTIIKSEYTDS